MQIFQYLYRQYTIGTKDKIGTNNTVVSTCWHNSMESCFLCTIKFMPLRKLSLLAFAGRDHPVWGNAHMLTLQWKITPFTDFKLINSYYSHSISKIALGISYSDNNHNNNNYVYVYTRESN